jgi:hypothetical protein
MTFAAINKAINAELNGRGLSVAGAIHSSDEALLSDLRRLVTTHIVDTQPLGTSRLPVGVATQLTTAGSQRDTMEVLVAAKRCGAGLCIAITAWMASGWLIVRSLIELTHSHYTLTTVAVMR